MPQIKIKTSHVRRLKELGVYDKWLTNVKMKMNSHGIHNINFTNYSLNALMKASFVWSTTPEGIEFWIDVSEKL